MRPSPFARTQNVGEFQGIRFDARARRLKRTNVVALDTVPMFTSSSRPLTMRSFAVFFAIPLVTRARLFVLSGLAVSISQFLYRRARATEATTSLTTSLTFPRVASSSCLLGWLIT